MSKAKAHTRYITQDKIRLPGVTTITGLRAKPFLIKWANDLGLKGIDSTKFRDEKGEAGTLCHEMILNHIEKKQTDTSDYSQNVIKQAENSFLSYLNWEKQHKIEPILVEVPLISTELRFGGTPDLLAYIDEVTTLLDFKTGKGIYKEFFYQVGAYGLLLENGQTMKDYKEVHYKIENYIILNIPRAENESFKEEQKKSLKTETEIFLRLLDIYYLEKK